ncbi:MAG TPA: DUF1553 domain-containing protein [Verrucomicrobiae bacterium]|nr:DUF1553 domain-containing protein [Verrucomicrobiae bacterium]
MRILTTLAVVFLAVAGEAASLDSGAKIFESSLSPTPDSPLDKLVYVKVIPLNFQPTICSDAVFVRRAFLDVIGTLPTAKEAREFIQDPDAKNKRRLLIDRLLERDEFAEYWSMKWGDILRIKAEFPVNLWPNAAQAYHRWVVASIAENKPYDKFVREMLTSSGSNFRVGPVNFYRAIQNRTPEGIAMAVALTFMGTRTDSWPKERLAGMAAFFSQVGYKPSREWKEEIVFWDPLGLGTMGTNSPPSSATNSAPASVTNSAPAKTVSQVTITVAENRPPLLGAPAPGPAAATNKSATPSKASSAPAGTNKPAATAKAPGAPPKPATSAKAPPPPITVPLTPVPVVNLPPTVGVFPDGTRVKLTTERDPREVFADWLINPKNPWFTRNIANRLWAWLLGRGIIHEPDDIRDNNPPSNPALLAYLEKEMIANKYDMKRMFRLILNSKTYQFSSMPRPNVPQAEARFGIYGMRRLEAEVLIDAVNKITGATDLYTSPIPEPFTYIPQDKPAVALADGSITSPFLALFGRSARATGMENERINKPVPAQWMHMLNSSHIYRKIDQGPKIRALVDPKRKPGEIVEELFLTILSRFPTPEEVKTFEAYGRAGGPKRREDWVDFIWSLINSEEFQYRH